MPGTPDPALGSDLLTRAAALLAAVAIVSLSFVLDRKSPRRLAVGGGVAYAGFCLACWLGARLLTGMFTSALVESPGMGSLLVLGALVVLGAQAAVPLYAYRRYGTVAPLAGLALATGIVVYAFLRVNGETDPLGLYTLFFGPMTVVALTLLAGVELGGRRLYRSVV